MQGRPVRAARGGGGDGEERVNGGLLKMTAGRRLPARGCYCWIYVSLAQWV